MKVAVTLTGLDPILKARAESFIRENWPQVIIYDTNQDPTPRKWGNHEATLAVVNTTTITPRPPTTRNETIILNGQTVEEALYLVNAKLGRLTESDIAFSESAPSRELPLSRREFLFGMLGRSAPSANAAETPVVSSDYCEVRFGCRKCVDTCPAPGALEIRQDSVIVSKEHCIKCGLCAGICPVAAISVPELPESAYRGLLGAIDNSGAAQKTLVITCCEEKVPKIPWVDVEHVPGIAVMGIRQLALAASTSINAIIVYCPDGKCVGIEHVKRAVKLINSVTKASPPSLYYLEGKEAQAEIEHIHYSTPRHDNAVPLPPTAWKSYVAAIEKISTEDSRATGLGFTDIQIAESCTLCNACVDKCPHAALEIEDGELLFDSRECTGCGYCRQICPEKAIALLERDGSTEFSEKAIYKDEMVRCSECNAPYASAKMVRKVSVALNGIIQKCPACREKAVYDAIIDIASAKAAN